MYVYRVDGNGERLFVKLRKSESDMTVESFKWSVRDKLNIVEELSGCIPATMTLEESREEWLKEHIGMI